MARISGMSDTGTPAAEVSALSERERLVAEKFAAGMTYREIGDVLFIAPSTVRTHLAAVYSKLLVHNKVGLAARLGAARGEETENHADFVSVRPALAAFPIESLNPEDHWHRFTDGLTSDLIVDLARYADLPVERFIKGYPITSAEALAAIRAGARFAELI